MANTKNKPVKKKKQSRAFLDSPWSTKWSSIKTEDENIILEEIKSVVIKYPQLKLLQKSFCKKMKLPVQMLSADDKVLGKKLREELVFGVNNVTRHLEKNLLAAVLLSHQADPPHLTKHILPLCATRNVPIVSLKEMKEKVAKLLNFSSLLAFGLKRGVEEPTSMFHTLWKHIKGKAITFPCPHDSFNLNATKADSQTCSAQVNNSVDDVKESADRAKDASKKKLSEPNKITNYNHLYVKIQNSKQKDIALESFMPLEKKLTEFGFPVYNHTKTVAGEKANSESSETTERTTVKKNKRKFDTVLLAAKLKHAVPSGKVQAKRRRK